MTDTRTRIARLLLAAAATAAAAFPAVAPASAWAQQGAPGAAAPERSNETLLRDFIHFVLIARYDVARGLAQELLDRNIEPTEFVALVEASGEAERFERAVAEAMRVSELEEPAAQLSRQFRAGKLAVARNPEQIQRNIELLTGTSLLGRQLARERLIAAGEYAMPQLLGAFLNRAKPAERAAVQSVLVGMGRQAVVPLVTALPELPGADQEQVLNVLGLIQYRTSVPYIAELRQRTNSPEVARAAEEALVRLGARPEANIPAMYQELAERYYLEPLDLTSFPNEDYQILWAYDPGIGLLMTPVVTPVFHEAMAMDLAERSLRLNGQNPEAIALWIASNYSREIDSPENYDNPAYPADRRDAAYFATAAGTDIAQRVLRRGLDTRDTPLVRRVLAAIEPTAGASAMLTRDGEGRQPLLEALDYPNRRVQYESALAIGASQPTQAFAGSERVVPLLASAIRDAGSLYAVVLADTREEYTRLQRLLEEQGYAVLPPADRGLADLRGPIAGAPGIDLVVTSLPASQTDRAIRDVRNDSKLRVAPVLVLAASGEIPELGRAHGRDQSVAIRRETITEEELIASVNDLIERSVGGVITREEAEAYSVRALAVLRDLALSGNTVLDAGDATQPLILALEERTDATRLDVAEVLARIAQPRAQQALAEAALDASGAERLALLGKLADSAKRSGNQLAPRQVGRLIELANAADLETATAAAAALGALGLPNERIVPLILGSERTQARVTRN